MGVLDGKAAIVTGSARGIGRATAALLAEHGARVLVNDVDADAAEQTAGELGAELHTGDLTADGVAEELVQRAVDAFGGLDIVVNNAGYTWDGMAHKMTDEQFRAMLEIHAVAPFRVLRAAAPHLRDPAKREAEEGLVGMTKTLAREWGPFKVNVNAVAFGFVETRMTASLPERMREAAPQIIPLGRPAAPEEAAGAIFLLCTPWSNFIHGQVITASGGQTTGMTT
jgi:3-oxoacyl-[acyl-carrier protein] reductase